jgi:hypothetical protein
MLRHRGSGSSRVPPRLQIWGVERRRKIGLAQVTKIDDSAAKIRIAADSTFDLTGCRFVVGHGGS